MRRFVLFAAVALLLSGAQTAMTDEKPGATKKLLRHVVLFQFKETSTPAQVDEIARVFAALPKKIDAIEDFEWGTDVSVENKAQGFTHGFVVTFRDEKGRDEYLPHPEHQKFVKLVGPHVEKVLVFDFWAKR